MSFLATIDEIGKAIEKKSPSWEDFPSEVATELQHRSLPALFDPEALSELRQRHTDCEEILGRKFLFSDECFYLYVGPGFTIELYHWIYSDTAIHDHDFQGAFQCLKGMNYQKEFRFFGGQEIFEGFQTGSLQEISSHVVSPGKIELIRDEDRYIHVVSHEDSTFNLCIRTTKKGLRPLRVYHVDGVRFVVPDTIREGVSVEEMTSEELLYIAHHGKVGDSARKVRACGILRERHGIEFLKSQHKTWDLLNQLSSEARGY